MAVFFDIDHLPGFNNAVVTIGTFDGVHLGHRVILQEVVDHAKEVGGESVVITFEPHPRKLLHPDQPLGIITPLHQKMLLIHDTGIQHIVVAPFTQVFAHQSAATYLEDFMVGNFKPRSIVLGYDHRFGHDRLGDIGMLQKYAPKYGYELKEIPAQLIEDAAVSSTKIRNAILGGRVDEAANMLGRNYSLKGLVVHGNKLGRTIGFPTANIMPDEPSQVLPAIGIYAVYILHHNRMLRGMANIGYNPTVGKKNEIKIEVNIFDFDEDIYGNVIELHFIKRTRDEQKFPSLDALKVQLGKDQLEIKLILNERM